MSDCLTVWPSDCLTVWLSVNIWETKETPENNDISSKTLHPNSFKFGTHVDLDMTFQIPSNYGGNIILQIFMNF